MPYYTFATLANAQTALANRLYDPLFQQWPAAELTLYIQEALRTWNALTSFWRDQFTFPLVQAVNFYDITNLLTAPNTLRPVTLEDSDLLQVIETQLLEPATTAYPLVWTGSKQFTVGNILGALTGRQNETLGQTGCTITIQTPAAPTSAAAIVLADSTIDIRRVRWIPTNPALGYTTAILRQTDIFSKTHFDYRYKLRPMGVPNCWMQATEPPPQFDIDRVPPTPGSYEVLTTQAGNTFNTVAPQLLSVPDDWSWVVKWGVLAELLSNESNAKDQPRAAYAARRYLEGLMFLQNASSVLSLDVNQVEIGVDGITNGDNYNYQWQAAAQAPPQTCYTTGLNLVAFPPLDGGFYIADIGVVRNAPVPYDPTDYIQCSRSDYPAILDYAQHLAMFKIPGIFSETIPLYQAFLERASIYNRKLRAMGQLDWAAYDISRTEEERNPRMVEVQQ